jgi:phosphate transport system substrate-binding protein
MRDAESVHRGLENVAAVVLASALMGGCQTGLSRVTAVVRNAGSDTMVNVAQAWAEEYAKVNPSVSVEVAGGGSATGIAALIDGAADLANCSRPVEREEIETSKQKKGRAPKAWIVGVDALAVYVNRGNPLDEISLEQLAELYGRAGGVDKWTSLGVRIPGRSSDEIVLISRQSNSGTYQYFRQAILGPKGDFRPGTLDLNGSKEVVMLVGNTPGAIGYSGMGYDTPAVKMLRVSRKSGEPAYAPTAANAASGAYPISRPLYIYTLGEPTGATAAYLAWILSPAGQRVLEQSGYVPVGSKGPVQ